jgi:hypothetical protein
VESSLADHQHRHGAQQLAPQARPRSPAKDLHTRLGQDGPSRLGGPGYHIRGTTTAGLHLAPVDVEALTPPSHCGTSPLQYHRRSTAPPPAEKGTATSGEIPATTIAAWPRPVGPLAAVSGESWRLGESLGLTAAGAPCCLGEAVWGLGYLPAMTTCI